MRPGRPELIRQRQVREVRERRTSLPCTGGATAALVTKARTCTDGFTISQRVDACCLLHGWQPPGYLSYDGGGQR